MLAGFFLSIFGDIQVVWMHSSKICVLFVTIGDKYQDSRQKLGFLLAILGDTQFCSLGIDLNKKNVIFVDAGASWSKPLRVTAERVVGGTEGHLSRQGLAGFGGV